MERNTAAMIEASVMSGKAQRQMKLDSEIEPVEMNKFKTLPMIKRRQGEAGEQDDKHIVEFMKLVEIMEDQRSTKMTDLYFRDSNRKRSMYNHRTKGYSTENFI